MYRIILFLLLIALAAAGAAWMADQSGDVVLSWDGWRVQTSLPVFALALGVIVVAAMLAWTHPARAVAHAGTDPARPARTASGARPARHHPRAARDRPWRFSRGPRACRGRAQPRRRTIRWRCCCMRNRRSSTATATARSARSAPWPNARTRGCWACAGCSSRRSAPTIRSPRSMIAEEALKLAPASTWASQAVLGISLRQGRLERGADDPRQQSRVGPDRQTGLAASARRAADGARARTRNDRPRPCRATP